MVRTKQTARKSTAWKPRPIQLGRLDTFYSYKMVEGQSMSWFLQQFMQRWAAVRGLGVTELDGVLQLVQAIPSRWRAWAAEAALEFVHPGMEFRVMGNLVAFVNFLKEHYDPFRDPPPCLHPPLDPHQFILEVHRILENISSHREGTVEPGTNDTPNEESEPEEYLEEESEPEEYIEDEPPLPSVGTSTLQPLSINEMQRGTTSSTPVPGDPSHSNTGNFSTAADTGVEASVGRAGIEDDSDDKAV